MNFYKVTAYKYLDGIKAKATGFEFEHGTNVNEAYNDAVGFVERLKRYYDEVTLESIDGGVSTVLEVSSKDSTLSKSLTAI